METVKTVGIDLDAHNGYELVKAVINARRFGEVKTFYTRHGFHLIIQTEHPITVEESMYLRHLLGDDKKRLEYDEAKIELGLLNLIDTLFMVKVYPDGSIFHRYEFEAIRK